MCRVPDPEDEKYKEDEDAYEDDLEEMQTKTDSIKPKSFPSLRSNSKSGSTHKTASIDLQSECGIEGPPSKDRIVGGFEAEPNQWPWQVALFVDNAWFC